jgi:gas vesicle protein
MAMDKSNESRNLGLGILIGTIIGGALGVLFAPQSGEKNRKQLTDKVREMADRVQSESAKLYKSAKDEIDKKLTDTKNKMDKTKYTRLVNQVIDDLQTDGDIDKTTADKVKDRLKEDWNTVKNKMS